MYTGLLDTELEAGCLFLDRAIREGKSVGRVLTCRDESPANCRALASRPSDRVAAKTAAQTTVVAGKHVSSMQITGFSAEEAALCSVPI